MQKIIKIEAKDNYKLYLKFNDGVEGEVDLSVIARNGVFEPWNNMAYFKDVKIDEVTGAPTWNNELDIDVLNQYLKLTNLTFEDYLIKNNASN